MTMEKINLAKTVYLIVQFNNYLFAFFNTRGCKPLLKITLLHSFDLIIGFRQNCWVIG